MKMRSKPLSKLIVVGEADESKSEMPTASSEEAQAKNVEAANLAYEVRAC